MKRIFEPELEKLTTHEKEVVVAVFKNPHLSRQQIGDTFNISAKSVGNIICIGLKKLNLRCEIHFMQYAYNHGWIEVEPCTCDEHGEPKRH